MVIRYIISYGVKQNWHHTFTLYCVMKKICCSLILLSLCLQLLSAENPEKTGDEYFAKGEYGLAVKYYGQVSRPINQNEFFEKERRAKELRMIMMEADYQFENYNYLEAKQTYERLFRMHQTKLCYNKIKECESKIRDGEIEDSIYYLATNTYSIETKISNISHYISLFPTGKYAGEMKLMYYNIDDDLWEYLIEHKDANYASNKYLELFPNGTHADDAKRILEEYKNKEENAWSRALRINTIESFNSYIEGNYELHRDEAFSKRSYLLAAKDKWQSIKNSTNIKLFNDYITQYPNCEYTQEARLRKEQLEDNQAWNEALKINTVKSYTDYIESNRTKNKKHIDDANLQISLIRDEERWQNARSIGTIEEYQKYIQNCNDSGNRNCMHIMDAQRQIKNVTDIINEIQKAENYYANKKYEDAYNTIVSIERRYHEIPKYLNNRALKCTEEHYFRESKKQKSRYRWQQYLSIYKNVASPKHLKYAKKKLGQ